MVDGLINNNDNSNIGFVSTLDSYSINELVNLYITYSRVKYFIEHDNMDEILDYISSYIVNNLSKLSYLETMDLYSKIMIEVLDLEKMMESNKNIVQIRTNNLKDEFFLEMEAKTYNMNKDIFVEKYKRDLSYFKRFDGIYERIHDLLDKFQKDIFRYLNTTISNLSIDERDKLLKEINSIVDQNSLEIIKRIEIKHDKKKMAIHSKFSDSSPEELYDKLDTFKLEHQNYVYLNYQAILNDLSKGNSK